MKRFGTQENDRLIELDKINRRNFEKRWGETLTDDEWFIYKVGFREATKLINYENKTTNSKTPKTGP